MTPAAGKESYGACSIPKIECSLRHLWKHSSGLSTFLSCVKIDGACICPYAAHEHARRDEWADSCSFLSGRMRLAQSPHHKSHHHGTLCLLHSLQPPTYSVRTVRELQALSIQLPLAHYPSSLTHHLLFTPSSLPRHSLFAYSSHTQPVFQTIQSPHIPTHSSPFTPHLLCSHCFLSLLAHLLLCTYPATQPHSLIAVHSSFAVTRHASRLQLNLRVVRLSTLHYTPLLG